MSNNIIALEAFENVLNLIRAIETGNMPIAITTGTALLSDVQSFIKDSVKISAVDNTAVVGEFMKQS